MLVEEVTEKPDEVAYVTVLRATEVGRAHSTKDLVGSVQGVKFSLGD